MACSGGLWGLEQHEASSDTTVGTSNILKTQLFKKDSVRNLLAQDSKVSYSTDDGSLVRQVLGQLQEDAELVELEDAGGARSRSRASVSERVRRPACDALCCFLCALECSAPNLAIDSGRHGFFLQRGCLRVLTWLLGQYIATAQSERSGVWKDGEHVSSETILPEEALPHDVR